MKLIGGIIRILSIFLKFSENWTITVCRRVNKNYLTVVWWDVVLLEAFFMRKIIQKYYYSHYIHRIHENSRKSTKKSHNLRRKISKKNSGQFTSTLKNPREFTGNAWELTRIDKQFIRIYEIHQITVEKYIHRIRRNSPNALVLFLCVRPRVVLILRWNVKNMD